MNPNIKERSFEFAVRIVSLCRELENKSATTKTLLNQLIRAGTSIGANIEEAQGGQSKADFTAKMSIACKEARETHYWLRLIIATEIVKPSRLESLLDESDQIVAILTTIVKNSKNTAGQK